MKLKEKNEILTWVNGLSDEELVKNSLMKGQMFLNLSVKKEELSYGKNRSRKNGSESS